MKRPIQASIIVSGRLMNPTGQDSKKPPLKSTSLKVWRTLILEIRIDWPQVVSKMNLKAH